MNHDFSCTHAPELAVLLKNAKYLSVNEEFNISEEFLRFSGDTLLDTNYVEQSGGILRAISRKSVERLRADLTGMSIKAFTPEIRNNWKYILLHSQPHLDEYLASFLLRACLPDEMFDIEVDETILFSKDNDLTAKEMWPKAAVLGVGNLINGGAEPLLLFDEHESSQEERTHTSLAILMKRYLLNNQRPPDAFYKIMREVNYIDQYGSPFPKSLAVYTKYIQAAHLPTASNAEMSSEWKCALLDASLSAFYAEMQREEMPCKKKSNWEPAVLLSLNDFAERTFLRDFPEFEASFQKIKNYLTKGFSYNVSKGNLTYEIPNIKNPRKTSQAVCNLLIPYLPYLLFKYWGGLIGQMLLFPMWESRVLQDILFTRTSGNLKTIVASSKEDIIKRDTDFGVLSICYTKKMTIENAPIVVIDIMSEHGLSSTAPINSVLKMQAGGIGFSIFRSAQTNSVIFTKGGGIPNDLWERVCNELIALEGLSDSSTSCGAWHIVKNPNGIAPFILNGNSTHRYVPQSTISAQSIVEMLDSMADQEDIV